MKYMLLIFNNPEAIAALPDAERDGIFADVDKIMAELAASGEWVGGEGLAPAAQGWTVRVRDQVPVITDGPFAEAKEQLAGYLMVDVATKERALDIAARWPDARYWAMEVRQVMTPPPDEAVD
jgi:hypothetical protein